MTPEQEQRVEEIKGCVAGLLVSGATVHSQERELVSDLFFLLALVEEQQRKLEGAVGCVVDLVRTERA